MTASDKPATGGLTTGTVARMFGIAPTTLRTWERRYGLGPAQRVRGKHRRWSEQDIDAVRRMCTFTAGGVPPAEAARAVLSGETLSPAPVATVVSGRAASLQPGGADAASDSAARRGLLRAAERLDGPELDTRLSALLVQYGLIACWERVLVPTLHAVGQAWQDAGDQHVEVEHLLSWHVSGALRRTMSAAPVSAARTAPVLLACVPAEQHTLALEALAAALAERGVAARMFGAAVPPEALGQAVERLGPAAVVLWSQARSTASKALAAYVTEQMWGVRGARTHATVVTAGPGWAGPAVPGTVRPVRLQHAVEAICGPPVAPPYRP